MQEPYRTDLTRKRAVSYTSHPTKEESIDHLSSRLCEVDHETVGFHMICVRTDPASAASAAKFRMCARPVSDRSHPASVNIQEIVLIQKIRGVSAPRGLEK